MYLVLHAPTINDLQHQVSAHLADGWLPTGGVTTQIYYTSINSEIYSNSIVPTSSSSHTIYYLQAVYKPQPKDLS